MWCAYDKYLRAKNKVTSYFKTIFENLYKTSFVLSIESKKTYAIESLFFDLDFKKKKRIQGEANSIGEPLPGAENVESRRGRSSRSLKTSWY